MQSSINILVVDDEEIMRNLFTDILQDEGYKVTCVNDGRQAEDKVKSEFFNIAFIDIHMPVMDGIKTLRLIRQSSPNTNIVMMDSMPAHLFKEAQREGAVDCIYKPFNIQEVRSIVNGILKKQENVQPK